MMIKPETTTTTATVSSAVVACGNCGVEEQRLLHHVRHRGIFRRLCTTCVLRLHAQSFCPTCFHVYPSIPSNDAVINCCKCYSSSHSHCVSSGSTSLPSPYVCPLCTNPNTPIFKLKTAKEANVEFNEGNEDFQVIDRDAAKKLLAAAKIASTSMNKAVVAAKLEAERRAKEAAFARKRAKEALEHVAHLVMKKRLSNKEVALSGSGAGGVGVSYLGISGAAGLGGANVKRENNMNVILGNRNGNVGGVDSLVVTEERIVDTKTNVDEVDNSARVLAALNAVELKENDKISGISAQEVELGAPVNDDHAVMDVDEKARTRGVAGEEVAELMLEGDNGNSETAIFAHVGVDEVDHDMQGDKQEEVNDEVVLVQPMADQMESMENGNCGEQHDNGTPL
ncbi:uncharacterized protein [Primulina huaijiensis]|uniref:uncharacterized protein n=1 Tax=Primulina huaijiensis TaxID=1492673 RepID=UPI003CC6E992